MKKQKDPLAVELGRRGGSTPTKKKKGFAAMDPELRRKYSAKGGTITARKKQKAEARKKKLARKRKLARKKRNEGLKGPALSPPPGS